ncbi:MAG: tRNA (adenosine(37)-N6)-dimethylallyltransferase MiaA [Bacteroidota bacterium]
MGGATASGKTATAIQVAQHFNTEILSCDSRQFYKEMSIGTAKPSTEELATVPHHFINSLSIQDYYSVGDYERDALTLLDRLFEQKQVVVMAGGSGLYIQAVCEGLNHFPDVPTAIRTEVEALFQQKGITALQEELKIVDPTYYAKVDLQNPHRLIRAIAVYRASGKAFSSFQNQPKSPRNFTPIYLLLDWEREQLYSRINQRVDQMLAAGLEQEVRSLLPYQQLTALQTVGYQELFDFFNDKIDREGAIRLIKRNTRRYAKRQMTWFRRSEEWKHFSAEAIGDILSYLEGCVLG